MLKAMRLKRGITQAELAKMVGISQPSLCNIENGKINPTINTLRKLAKALECNISELIDGDGDSL